MNRKANSIPDTSNTTQTLEYFRYCSFTNQTRKNPTSISDQKQRLSRKLDTSFINKLQEEANLEEFSVSDVPDIYKISRAYLKRRNAIDLEN